MARGNFSSTSVMHTMFGSTAGVAQAPPLLLNAVAGYEGAVNAVACYNDLMAASAAWFFAHAP